MDFLNYIYPNAKPLDRSQIKEGDIVAFDSEYGRGVALMQDGSWFHSSYNLVEKNRVWVSDSMPDDIQLFTPTKEDILLAIDYLEGPEAEDEYGMNPHEFLDRWNHKAIYKLEQAVNDLAEIKEYLKEYSKIFNLDFNEIINHEFSVVTPNHDKKVKTMYVGN